MRTSTKTGPGVASNRLGSIKSSDIPDQAAAAGNEQDAGEVGLGVETVGVVEGTAEVGAISSVETTAAGAVGEDDGSELGSADDV